MLCQKKISNSHRLVGRTPCRRHKRHGVSEVNSSVTVLSTAARPTLTCRQKERLPQFSESAAKRAGTTETFYGVSEASWTCLLGGRGCVEVDGIPWN